MSDKGYTPKHRRFYCVVCGLKMIFERTATFGQIKRRVEGHGCKRAALIESKG